jgi:flagellar biosynthesis protein FlhG
MPTFSGEKNAGTEVWAIGGGKGGTGKSFLTSSMGMCLASRGERVVLIDADLGGANLHSFLGVRRPKSSLTDFFERRTPLEELIVDTGIERLGLVTGDVHSLASDDIKYTQKMKLFRHIKGLRADYVLIDLGSGSNNNTIDTFLFADRMIVVLIPEITSIENMYHFIKNVFFRKLKVALGKYGMKDTVTEVWRKREMFGIKNIRELVTHLKERSPSVSDVLDQEVANFEIRIILNQVRSGSEIPIGASIKSVFRKMLGFTALYVGYVEYDDLVLRCTNNGRPFMLNYPSSQCAREIQRLSNNVIEDIQVKVMSP